jgi:hypothetical protein
MECVRSLLACSGNDAYQGLRPNRDGLAFRIGAATYCEGEIDERRQL